MTIALAALTFLTAALDWAAVYRGWKRIELAAKPATMILLLGVVGAAGGWQALPLACFGLGLFFSLLGDIFLLVSFVRFSERWFLPGLAAFLLAHLAYIAGLNIPLGEVSPFWMFTLALVLALTARRALQRIVAGLRAKGLGRLVRPVVLYGFVITVMLLSALLTLYRPDWSAGAAGLVSLGAILFYLSDLLLAWNKFVRPIRNGRLFNMVAYHLGQFALAAGMLLQFARG
ncbi:MAG: lysoplasmalogenase family protein [Anaerolineales bacterium]